MIYQGIDRWNSPSFEHYGVKGMKWKSHKYAMLPANATGLRKKSLISETRTVSTAGDSTTTVRARALNPRVSKKETKDSARYAINQAYKPKATVKKKIQSRLLNVKSRLRTRGRKIVNKICGR